MQTGGERWRWVLALALAGLAAGCVKLKNQTLVMPDGSGKIIMTFAVNEEALKQALPLLGSRSDKAPKSVDDISASALDVEAIEKNSDGIVAYTKPAERSDGGWKYITLTGYFDDINQVRIRDGEKRGVALSFVFRKTDAGFLLDADNLFVKRLTDQNLLAQMGDLPPQMMGMVGPMFEGFSLVESYKMPGEVQDVKGLTRKEGRLAGISYNEQVVLNQEEAKKASTQTHRTISCGLSHVTPAEASAFKAELAKAKADWSKRQAAKPQP